MRRSLLCLAAIATLSLALGDVASAQMKNMSSDVGATPSRGNVGTRGPVRGGNYGGGGFRGAGWARWYLAC
jgi:hypothetical protein